MAKFCAAVRILARPPSTLDLSLYPNLKLLAQRCRRFLCQVDQAAAFAGALRSVVDLQAAINRVTDEYNRTKINPLAWNAGSVR